MELIGVYAVKNKDEKIRANSRSGGIFTAISDYILEKGGVVYGCVLDDDLNAVHSRAVNKQQRDLMRGSKYVQSSMGDTFKNVKDDLEHDKYVLFSGTSCQVAGLKGYLGKEYQKLFCIDIVCHGVPSGLIWQDYKKWNEEKKHHKVCSVDFRNKRKFGWHAHVETLYFENNTFADSEVYRNLFYGHNILRPSCYKCPYKSIFHPGDITIGDYWGIDKAAPGFNDNKGVSLVLINSQKGEKIFEKIKPSLKYRKTRIEDSLQPPLISSFPEPVERKQFWDEYRKEGFEYIARKYGNYSPVHEKLGYIKRFLKKLLKRP